MASASRTALGCTGSLHCTPTHVRACTRKLQLALSVFFNAAHVGSTCPMWVPASTWRKGLVGRRSAVCRKVQGPGGGAGPRGMAHLCLIMLISIDTHNAHLLIMLTCIDIACSQDGRAQQTKVAPVYVLTHANQARPKRLLRGLAMVHTTLPSLPAVDTVP